MIFKTRIYTEGKQNKNIHWGKAKERHREDTDSPHREFLGWWRSAFDKLTSMTRHGLAPLAPLSLSLTPAQQQFSILLLQLIYCPEHTLFIFLFNILLTSSSWKSPFFSLFICLSVAHHSRPTILAYGDFSLFWTSIVLNSIPLT